MFETCVRLTAERNDILVVELIFDGNDDIEWRWAEREYTQDVCKSSSKSSSNWENFKEWASFSLSRTHIILALTGVDFACISCASQMMSIM